MRSVHIRALAVAAILVAGGCIGAQQVVPARPLGPILSTAAERLGSEPTVVALSDGRLVVNDPTKRRVLLFDSLLTRFAVVIGDTTAAASQRYGQVPGAILRYIGDTTLFLDAESGSFIVIEPSGAIGRVLSVPRTGDVPFMAKPLLGSAAFDARGRLVYMAVSLPGPGSPGPGAIGVLGPDSAAIVRADMTTHQVDTIARIRTPPLKSRAVVSYSASGERLQIITVDPFIMGDAWAVTRDGTIAVVRAQDYHLDWIGPDGAASAGPKIAHDWHRLSDSDKASLVDSIQHQLEPANARNAAMSSPMRQASLAADQLADYAPPFALRPPVPDVEGNLWIQSQSYPPAPGGPIYDVVNRQGVLIDRVQLPGGCTLVGLGRGIAYLASREGNGTVLARARSR